MTGLLVPHGALAQGQRAPEDTASPASKEAPDSGEPRPPARPSRARAGQAVVTGQVIDQETGVPLVGATVRVIDGGDYATRTGEDGSFELALPPGRYVLRVSYPIYESKRISAVVVGRRRAPSVDVSLAVSDDAIEEVVVYAEAEKRTEAGLLMLRKQSATVSDAVSAQEMSRTPDSNASDAVKRVVSATIVDNRYVLLRGLGGRYVTTLLNGVPLPSPEPDRQAVPLDLFPTSLLSNLLISKSYSPAYPGTFGGGTLQVETTTYPDDFKLSLKASTAGNTATTFGDIPGYPGGSLDVLGFDDGTRGLPSSVPAGQPLKVGDGIDVATMEDIGESFTNQWVAEPSTAYPKLGVGVTVGDTLTPPRGEELGYLATASYGHSASGRDAQVAKVRSADGAVEYREQVNNRRGKRAAKLGGLVAAGYRLDRSHAINVVSLYTHHGESSTQKVTGVNETDGLEMDSSRLRFVERWLSFTQLGGRHMLDPARELELRWQGNVSLTRRYEPDTRDLVYNLLSDGRARFKNETGSGERFFSELAETSLGTGADVSVRPWPRIRLAGGAMVQRADRTFSARRFRYTFVGTDPATLFLPPGELFTSETIGPSFRLDERTLSTDAYEASQWTAGGYALTELNVAADLHVSAGLRYELATQSLTPGSPYGLGTVDEDDQVSRADRDLLPGVSATYSLRDDMNLRAAYSYTLARPRFRELAPFVYFDYTRRRTVSGNPDLVITRIHNTDLRWEWFPGGTDVFAASVFYKQFDDAIEQVIVSASGDVSYDNAPAATTMGFELEARTSLERVARRLADFRVWTNLTLIRSSVEFGEDQGGTQTNRERPMQGQSPYVVNVGLSYSSDELGADFTALYNVFGRRLAEVGFDTLPDVYEQPVHRVDVAGQKRVADDLKLKLAVTNALNSSVVLEQGDLDILRYKPGVGVSLSLTWSP